MQLVDNVLHAAGNNENDATAALTFTASDNDGDSTNGTLTITFDDDAPTAVNDTVNQPLENDADNAISVFDQRRVRCGRGQYRQQLGRCGDLRP